MPTYRLLDATGNVLATADDPTDLFDADEADDEIALAILDCVETGEAFIGGGAAPLFVLERYDDACRVCGEPIRTCELCARCAEGNNPFETCDNAGRDMARF
jgi:hypothetical protein